MNISVIVKPNSKREGVVLSGEGTYTVRVSARPVEGKANERVVELLAAHFGIPKARVAIIRGTAGRKKIVQIELP
mgnify:CR=1 FL=1